VRVAVVLTTFQGERWVEQQVRSILEQTRPPDELLVYDDGSTDRTVEIVSGHVPVTVNPVRLGTVRSLEQGLRATGADRVFLADQDDLWSPDRVETMLAVDADLVFHDGRIIDAAGAPTGATLWQQVGFTPARQQALERRPLRTLLNGNPVTGATVAVSRRLLEQALPFPDHGWHDQWLALVAAASGLTLAALPAPLIDYRVHDSNAAGLPPVGLRARLRGAPAARVQRAELIAMLAELSARFPSPELTDAREHLRIRQGLPSARVGRPLPVLRHLLTGRYGENGGGWRTAAVDLLERRAD
jgi:hypothetical protein